MRVLVVRHHEVDSAGLVGEAFEERGGSLETLQYPADGALPSAGDYDHVIVLGSTSSVYEYSDWIRTEIEWLQSAAAPVLGICFGAQLLCAAGGGSVERSPQYELGWTLIDPSSVAPLEGAPGGERPRLERGPWFQFHGDRCVVPAGARVLATNEVGVQAFSTGTDLGVQFHPEVDASQLGRWMQGGGEAQAVALGKDPDALLAETAAHEPHARRRAAALVDLALSIAHTGGARQSGAVHRTPS